MTTPKLASNLAVPRANLDTSTRTSLTKADTALQIAPVTSVNGQTGAVTVTSTVGGTTTPVASQAAMLALAAHPGDIAKRTDIDGGAPFMFNGGDATQPANWVRVTGDYALTSDLVAEQAARASGDASTLASSTSYTDAAIKSLALKDPVRVAVLTNVNLASPGATLDSTVSMATNDAALLAGQTDPTQNGLYVWASATTPMTRRSDADTSAKMKPGTIVLVQEGSSADKLFELQTNAPILLGTTALTFNTASGSTTGLATQTDLNNEVTRATASELTLVPRSEGTGVLNGSGSPDSSVGAVGGFYFDKLLKRFWGPKTNTVAAGPFPTISVVDSFARANENPLSDAAQWGPQIYTPDARLALVSNNAVCNPGYTTQTFSSGYWNAGQWADSEAWATVASFAQQVSVGVRIQNPNTSSMNGYLITAGGSTGNYYNLHRVLNGTETSIGTIPAGIVLADGDGIGIRVIGSNITCYHKTAAGAWTQVLQAYDTGITTAGYAGLRILNQPTSPTVSAFAAGAVVESLTPVWLDSYQLGSASQIVPAPSGDPNVDFAALQGAINAVHAAGGGSIQGSAAVGQPYLVNQTLTWYPNVWFSGGGRGACTIQASANSRIDAVIKTDQFDALTGTSSQGGISFFGILNCTIDANAQNGGAAWCIKIFGHAYSLTDLDVVNGGIGGIWTESLGPGDEMEPIWQGVHVVNYGRSVTTGGIGYGVYYAGPHDLVMSNCFISTLHAANGNLKDSCTIYGLYTAGYGFGILLNTVHIWGRNHYGMWFGASSNNWASNCEVEGAFLRNVVVAQGRINWQGGTVYGTNGNSGTQPLEGAFQLGVAGGTSTYGNQIVGVHVFQFPSTGVIIDYQNSAGPNLIRLTNQLGSTPATVGTVPAIDTIEILGNNVTLVQHGAAASYTAKQKFNGGVALGSSSTVGQVFTATDTAGSGSWQTRPTAIGSVVVSGSPTNGQTVVASSSTAAAWGTPAAGAWAQYFTTTSKTAAYTAAAWEAVIADPTTASFTVTLPTSPAAGTAVVVRRPTLGTSLASKIVSVARGGTNTIHGSATALTLSLDGESFMCLYDGAGNWNVVSGQKSLAALDARYAALGAAGGYGTVEDASGVSVTARSIIQFAGTAVGSVADDSANSRTIVTLNAGTGGSAGASFANGFFGDGTDGAATLDGTNTYVSWTTKSASVYTMTRDVYASTLTVSSGSTLITAGFRILCSVAFVNGGTVRPAVGNGAGATGGSTSGGSIASTINGGAGSAAAVGGAGVGANPAFGGNGGGGGAGSSTAGGAGVAATIPASIIGGAQQIHALPVASVGYSINNGAIKYVQGGCSGAGGGGDGSNAGGGGGAGGGVVLIVAKSFTNTGTITAPGGNGANGTGGNAGGGGAGGGGLVLISTTVNNGTGTLSSPSGAAGSGAGTGSAGSVGTAGQTLLNVFS